MRSNIYIRIENEEIWESLKDKSGLVNDTLDLMRLSKPIKELGLSKKLGECSRHHIDKSRCGCS